jgi:hypothetical protein
LAPLTTPGQQQHAVLLEFFLLGKWLVHALHVLSITNPLQM